MKNPITLEQLRNASADAESLDIAINGDENTDVISRKGRKYPSLAKVLKLLKTAAAKQLGRVSSIAELRNYDTQINGARIVVDAYYENGKMGGGEFIADLNDSTTQDDGGACIVSTNGVRWKRLTSTTASVYDFGAVGDGVTDDTAAIQAALNTPYERIVLPSGTYRITTGLVSSVEGREIVSEGGLLLGGANDIAALTASGDRSVIRVSIDGNNKARQGVVVTGSGSLVEGCDIRNLYGTTRGADGIRATTSGGVTIRRNRIVGVDAAQNVVIGDSVGACRAIFLNNTEDATAPSVIEDNWCESITGEEGDAIHVLSFASFGVFLKAYATIRGNTIRGFNRRGVKVQAHNVDVVDNTLINTLSGGALTNAVAVVDIIRGNDVNVSRNVMECGTEFAGIFGNGADVAECNRLVIQDNIIKIDSTTKFGVYLTYVRASTIRNNIITGGQHAITAQHSTSFEITENKFTGGSGTGADILVQTTCREFVIANNVAMAGARDDFIKDRTLAAVMHGNVNARSSVFNGISVTHEPTYDLSLTGTQSAVMLWKPYTAPVGVVAGTRVKGHILIRPTLANATSSISVFVENNRIASVVVPKGTTLAEITFEVVFTGSSTQHGWVTCRTSTGEFSSSYGMTTKSNAVKCPIGIEVRNGSASDTMTFAVAQYEVIS